MITFRKMDSYSCWCREHWSSLSFIFIFFSYITSCELKTVPIRGPTIGLRRWEGFHHDRISLFCMHSRSCSTLHPTRLLWVGQQFIASSSKFRKEIHIPYQERLLLLPKTNNLPQRTSTLTRAGATLTTLARTIGRIPKTKRRDTHIELAKW